MCLDVRSRTIPTRVRFVDTVEDNHFSVETRCVVMLLHLSRRNPQHNTKVSPRTRMTWTRMPSVRSETDFFVEFVPVLDFLSSCLCVCVYVYVCELGLVW